MMFEEGISLGKGLGCDSVACCRFLPSNGVVPTQTQVRIGIHLQQANASPLFKVSSNSREIYF